MSIGLNLLRGMINAGKVDIHTVTDLLKAFLGNGSVNTANVQQWKMRLGGRMLLRFARQQHTNEDVG
jgi:hypothetical protein